MVHTEVVQAAPGLVRGLDGTVPIHRLADADREIVTAELHLQADHCWGPY